VPIAVATVTIAVVAQLLGNVYVIVDVPGVSPLTMPVAVPIIATADVLLLHMPPVMASVSGRLPPTHSVAGAPMMAGGSALTVTALAAEQPVT
jgi:hypothetical protein